MSTDVSEARAACDEIALMMVAARTSETSVDIQLRSRQCIPEDSEPLDSRLHISVCSSIFWYITTKACEIIYSFSDFIC
jgi:hypothetical protein